MGSARDSATARRAALEIVRTLQQHDHIAYFAGGCVRDELVGLEPTDYDVATDATPQRVTSLFTRTAEVGASFGVVLVRSRDATTEVATFRADGPYTDRRRPDRIQFSDPQSDAQRRDFTINALFIDPLAAPDAPTVHGHVIDFVGGMSDLHAKVIRAVGDPAQRLAEDHLRALRGVRLAARLGFAIDPPTAEAMRAHARELAGVSRERIGDEIRRMIAHPSRVVALAQLESLGLDEPVLGRARALGSLDVLASLPDDTPVPTGLAAWALDRGLALDASAIGHEVDIWRRALCLSNQERDDMHGALLILARLRADWDDMGVAPRKRLAASAQFDEAMRLLRAIDRPAADRIDADVRALATTEAGIAPPPLLTGEDLIAQGWNPGPAFGRILDRVYDAQLEGRVADKVAAMELARSLNV